VIPDPVTITLPAHAKVTFEWTLSPGIEAQSARIALEPLDAATRPVAIGIDTRQQYSGSVETTALGGRYRMHFTTQIPSAYIGQPVEVEILATRAVTLRVGPDRIEFRGTFLAVPSPKTAAWAFLSGGPADGA
jgi:hypothetical protein